MFRYLLISLCFFTNLLQAQEVKQRLILIGDAGEINPQQETLLPTGADLVLPNKTTIYFLGDNIYPDGMGLENSRKAETEKILQSQFEPFRKKGATIYFIAGNHDWDKSGVDGLAKIKAQEAFLKGIGDDKIRFVPTAGTLGPFVEMLTDSIVTILYDSEFWLFPHHEAGLLPEIEKEKQRFLFSLDSIAKVHKDKKLLVLCHHPMKSYGEHSLKFSVSEHLFPLRRFWKGLYIPLPVVGSVYPLLRSTAFRTAEDLKHPTYRELIQSVTKVLQDHPQVIYISGHDHGLQFIQDERFTQVISGSGAKTSHISKAKDLHYKHGQQGFAVMDFLQNGQIRVSFYIVDQDLVTKDFETVLYKD